MKDNVKEDHYFYEILVQTGPMLSHGTTSKVQFILSGDDGETQIRCSSPLYYTYFTLISKRGSVLYNLKILLKGQFHEIRLV